MTASPSRRKGGARAVLVPAALLVLAVPSPVLAEGLFQRPVGKALMSLVLPGSGQWSQGNHRDAAIHASLFAGSALAALHYFEKDDYLDDDQRYDDDREIQFYNDSTLKFDIFATLASDVAFYSAYAAYRDARQSEDPAGYRTPAPRESFNELFLAPFRLQYLARPTTFVPLLLFAGAITQIEDDDSDDGFYEIRYADDVNETELRLFYSFGIGMGPAVGEEAFFRGFLNNHLSHSLGPTRGLALSSLVFAAGHLGQGNQADFLTAGLAGAYLGWVQQRNGYAIGEGVALHFWGNFLHGLAALDKGGAAPNLVSFAYRF